MGTNCIVKFWFFLSFAISVLLADNSTTLIVYTLILTTLLAFSFRHVKPVIIRLKPFIFFLPIMIVLYVVFSIILTAMDFYQIMAEGCFALSKLLVMVAVMSLYFEISKTDDILIAVRSLWSKTKLPWRWAEDSLIFLELTLRFFPTFQRDWEHLRRARTALGLNQTAGRVAQIKQIANDFPALIFLSLRRADETALSIYLRGYGKKIPRGIVNPIPFTVIDGIAFVGVALIFYWVNFNATL